MKIKCLLAMAVTTVGVAGAAYLPGVGSPTAVSPKPPAVEVAPQPGRRIVCSGKVEAVQGTVNVSAQISGRLAEVRVGEGDLVRQGDVLATLEAARQAAEVTVAEATARVAEAELARLEAGNGDEEIAQALFAVKSAQAELAYANSSLARYQQLAAGRTITADELEQKRQRAEYLQHQVSQLQKQHEALIRGPLAVEIEVARSNLQLARARLERARVEHEYRIVRAPVTGQILQVNLHSGDSVLADEFTPIVQMADAGDLIVRLEVSEASVPALEVGLEGEFEIRGRSGAAGRLKIETIIPSFGPKRLFSPDTSERQDVRTLNVLCHIEASEAPLYLGQRITANFER